MVAMNTLIRVGYLACCALGGIGEAGRGISEEGAPCAFRTYNGNIAYHGSLMAGSLVSGIELDTLKYRRRWRYFHSGSAAEPRNDSDLDREATPIGERGG